MALFMCLISVIWHIRFHDYKMDCYAFVLNIIKIYRSYCICSFDHFNVCQIHLCVIEWCADIKKII